MAETILHNQPEGTPSDNELIAYGTPTTPTGNIKLSNFYSLLMSKLGFFKVNNVLDEIYGNSNAQSYGRRNLGVYSTANVDSLLLSKADADNVITKDSGDAFTPVLPTHPVNKKYVDDKFIFGTFAFRDVDDVATKTVSIGQTLASSDYMVVLTTVQPNGDLDYYSPLVANKTTATFDIVIAAVGSGINNINFEWMIIIK